MEFIDYYKILEISKSASEADIKKAFRKMARKYHPDVNPNDNEAKARFQQINEANEVLSDPEKRKQYDKYGKDWKHADQFEQQQAQYGNRQQRPPGGNAGWEGADFGGGDFSDFFSSMFGSQGQGGGQRRQASYRGQDLSAELKLDLKDAYTTHKQTLTVNGKTIRITIPAGVDNGQTIKLSNYGNPGVNGGPNGDLLITFSITNTTPFRRDGNNLYLTKEIDLYTALLGGEITAETFNGKVKLTVKPETQSNTKVKLKGKGFPVYKKDDEFGDLYITYQVTLPTNLSDREKELFTELSKLNTHGK